MLMLMFMPMLMVMLMLMLMVTVRVERFPQYWLVTELWTCYVAPHGVSRGVAGESPAHYLRPQPAQKVIMCFWSLHASASHHFAHQFHLSIYWLWTTIDFHDIGVALKHDGQTWCAPPESRSLLISISAKYLYSETRHNVLSQDFADMHIGKVRTHQVWPSCSQVMLQSGKTPQHTNVVHSAMFSFPHNYVEISASSIKKDADVSAYLILPTLFAELNVIGDVFYIYDENVESIASEPNQNAETPAFSLTSVRRCTSRVEWSGREGQNRRFDMWSFGATWRSSAFSTFRLSRLSQPAQKVIMCFWSLHASASHHFAHQFHLSIYWLWTTIDFHDIGVALKHDGQTWCAPPESRSLLISISAKYLYSETRHNVLSQDFADMHIGKVRTHQVWPSCSQVMLQSGKTPQHTNVVHSAMFSFPHNYVEISASSIKKDADVSAYLILPTLFAELNVIGDVFYIYDENVESIASEPNQNAETPAFSLTSVRRCTSRVEWSGREGQNRRFDMWSFGATWRSSAFSTFRLSRPEINDLDGPIQLFTEAFLFGGSRGVRTGGLKLAPPNVIKSARLAIHLYMIQEGSEAEPRTWFLPKPATLTLWVRLLI